MKRIVCIALSALLCCVGTAEAEKQQLHNDKGVVSAKTDAQTDRMKAASEGFHITPAATPDHVIGQGGRSSWIGKILRPCSIVMWMQ